MSGLRISASSLKSLSQCSYKFYLNRIEKLPESTHPKTSIGSCAHSVLECLFKPKHRKHYDIIMSGGSIYHSSAIKRMVKRWQIKYNLAQELIDDLDSIILCGLKNTNFLEAGADEIFDSEWEFNLNGKNFQSRGFVDRMARYADLMVIKDYKTLSLTNKTEEDLMEEFEIQGTIYQYAVMEKFGLSCKVEFYLLRYPPTSKKPHRHIRIVQPKTKLQLSGFVQYLEFMGTKLKNFGLSDAYANFAADEKKNYGFCRYVCQFRNPFDYKVIIGEKTTTSYFLTDKVVAGPGEQVEIRHYKGCPRFHS